MFIIDRCPRTFQLLVILSIVLTSINAEENDNSVSYIDEKRVFRWKIILFSVGLHQLYIIFHFWIIIIHIGK
jgi:hypothetical protein